MRVSNWDPRRADAAVIHASMDRLERAGEAVAARARALCPVGKDRDGGGKWGKREAGQLRDTIRVVRLQGDPRRNVRIYAGTREVFWARFVEYGTVFTAANPFLRRALNSAKAAVTSILLNGA